MQAGAQSLDGQAAGDPPENGRVRHVVVVGGGTAGWLAACLIAARADPEAPAPITVTLIEAPDIPTVGVGEGTWPTMRRTLERIGIGEAEFLLACDGAFKQGSRFDGWRTGAPGDSYRHPFTPPVAGEPRDLVAAWMAGRAASFDVPFAAAVGAQPGVCALDLAPRQRSMPDYDGALNYGYHLDAGRFAALLARQAARLGVRHVRDTVTRVVRAESGDVAAVETRGSGRLAGDLFLDCTGHAALLIGDAFGVPLVDRGGELFNDRALALQVPVAPGSAIASETIATAHAAGWIWDIGLSSRRGIGCVYSSAHASEDAAAAALTDYLRRTAPETGEPAIRRLTFRSAHRERFWHANVLAVGLAAGFLEPLEASAIVLIELSLNALLDGFPATRDSMPIHARRFNALFRERWDRIVEFLKLHYALSTRNEPYWRDHRDLATIPSRLSELLCLWRNQPPSIADLPMTEEIFPAASYQYVLYGMGFPVPPAGPLRAGSSAAMTVRLDEVRRRGRALAAGLPTHRAYLDALRAAAPALEATS